jgi:mono/diheme cytochrome c family protein
VRGRGGEALLATALLAALAAADELEDAGRLFKAQCAGCHTIPDRELAGDRAWLGQLPKTA